MGGQRQSDWCDGHLDGDPVGLDVVQHGVDVEAAVQPDPGAGVERHHDVEQPEDVRRRGHDLHAVSRRQVQRVTPVPHRRGERSVGVTHRLGHARRARAEHEQRIGFGSKGIRTSACPGVIGLVERQHRHQLGEHRMVADRVRRRGQRERVLDLGALPRRAQQDRRRTKPPDGPQRDDELRAGSTTSARRDRPARTPRCSSVVAMPLARASSCGRRVFPLLEGERDRLTHTLSSLAVVSSTLRWRIAYHLWRMVFSICQNAYARRGLMTAEPVSTSSAGEPGGASHNRARSQEGVRAPGGGRDAAGERAACRPESRRSPAKPATAAHAWPS